MLPAIVCGQNFLSNFVVEFCWNSLDVLPKLWKLFGQHFDDVGNLMALNVCRLTRPVDWVVYPKTINKNIGQPSSTKAFVVCILTNSFQCNISSSRWQVAVAYRRCSRNAINLIGWRTYHWHMKILVHFGRLRAQHIHVFLKPHLRVSKIKCFDCNSIMTNWYSAI